MVRKYERIGHVCGTRKTARSFRGERLARGRPPPPTPPRSTNSCARYVARGFFSRCRFFFLTTPRYRRSLFGEWIYGALVPPRVTARLCAHLGADREKLFPLRYHATLHDARPPRRYVSSRPNKLYTRKTTAAIIIIITTPTGSPRRNNAPAA